MPQFEFDCCLQELKYDSPALLDLNNEFLKLKPQPEIMCLGEEQPMKVGKYEAVVVPPDAMVPNVVAVAASISIVVAAPAAAISATTANASNKKNI